MLDRLTGETGAISRRSTAQLAAVTLGGTAESIPSLRQALRNGAVLLLQHPLFTLTLAVITALLAVWLTLAFL